MRGLLVFLAKCFLMILLTVLMGEALFRVVLGMRPLTTESLVWQYHPRWGWSHAPDAEDTFVKMAVSQSVKINSRGLREREIPYPKPEGRFRVLVIGDSAVVGFEVPPEQVFPRVAEDLLRARGHDVEFVNGGNRGYGTDQALLFLKDEGLRYRPDLVLYRWNGNDLSDNMTLHRPFRKFGKPWFELDASGGVTLRGTPVPDYGYEQNVRLDAEGRVVELDVPFSTRATLWFRDVAVCRSAFATGVAFLAAAAPQLARVLQRAGSYEDRRDLPASQGAQAHEHRLAGALIAEMERTAREGGAAFRLIFAGLPSARFAVEASGAPTLGDYERFLERIPSRSEIRVRMDPHWNELGHRLYAEVLVEELLADGVLDAGADDAQRDTRAEDAPRDAVASRGSGTR